MRKLPRSRLARDTVWGICNEAAALIATTLSFTLLGVKLQPKGYGAFLGLSAVVGPFASFATGGTFLAVLDNMKRDGRPSIDVARSCVTWATAIGSISSALAVTIVLFSIPGIGWQTVVLLCVGDLVLGSIANTYVGAIQIEQGFSSAARARIGYQLCRAIMLIVLWRTDNLRLLPYAVCQTSLSLTNCLVTSTIVRQHFRRAVFVGRPNRRDLKTVFTYSVGLSALSVQNDGDNFSLNKFGYAADAGRYGFAYRVVQLGLLPVNAFVGVTHVSFLETDANLRPIDRAIRLTKIALVYIALVSAIILVAAPLASRLLGPQFHGTDEIMRWLVPLIALRGIGTFAMNGLLGLGLNHLRTRILVINAAFTVGLYILLVPKYSWRGAVIATNASEVTLCVVAWVTTYYCQRRADRAGQQLIEHFTDTDDALQAIEGGEPP